MNELQAYTLGFLFGDGNIYPPNYRISIHGVTNDIKQLEHIFYEYLDWRKFTNNNVHRYNVKSQPATILYKGNKQLCYKLMNEGYYIPRNGALAINSIPKKYQFMWVRGLFDADGCLYHYNPNPAKALKQLSITGPRNFDWSFITKKLDYFKVHNMKTGSQIRVCSIRNIVKFMDYIYPKGFDNNGLQRKYKVYESMLQAQINTNF